ITRTKALQPFGLHEVLKVRNYGQCEITLSVSLLNTPDFQDMFETRHWLDPLERTVENEKSGTSACWRYRGNDDLTRSLKLSVEGDGRISDNNEAHWVFTLQPSQSKELRACYEFAMEGTEGEKTRTRPSGVFAP